MYDQLKICWVYLVISNLGTGGTILNCISYIFFSIRTPRPPQAGMMIQITRDVVCLGVDIHTTTVNPRISARGAYFKFGRIGGGG